MGEVQDVNGLGSTGRRLSGDLNFGAVSDTETAPIKVTAEGEQLVQLTGSNEQLEIKPLTVSNDIAASGNVTININASAEKLGELIHYGFRAIKPTGATSGTHRITVTYYNSGTYHKFLDLTANFDQDILVVRGVNKGTASSVTPSDNSLQLANTLGLMVSDTIAIKILYMNNTNVTQPKANISGEAFLLERS